MATQLLSMGSPPKDLFPRPVPKSSCQRGGLPLRDLRPDLRPARQLCEVLDGLARAQPGDDEGGEDGPPDDGGEEHDSRGTPDPRVPEEEAGAGDDEAERQPEQSGPGVRRDEGGAPGDERDAVPRPPTRPQNQRTTVQPTRTAA